MAGRPGRTGGVVQRRVTSWRCQRRIVEGVTSSPSRRRAGSSRARAAMTARSVQLTSAAVVCVVAARPVDGAGRGSRSPWRCRSGRAAPSSSAASRTSGRSASAPPADHAGLARAAKRQVNGCEHRFGHPQARHRSTSPAHLVRALVPLAFLPHAGLWRALCRETVRRFTRRWIAPSGGRGSGGGDLGATRLTWTRKREGTTAWRESVEYRGGVEGAAAQGPRDMAKARLLEAQSPAVQTSHPVTRRL